MEPGLFWKTLTFFNFLFFLLWVIFYTYQPAFMKDSDFVTPGASTRGGEGAKKKSDKYLSDPGRSFIFLSSLITSLVFVIISVILIKLFYRRRVIKCKKNAKGPGDCKFEKL
jgi:ABC-type spermidine/putrescine transport system permease subunit I